MKGAKWAIAVLGASGAVALLSAGPAAAKNCKTVKCLQKEVNVLNQEMATTTGEFKRLQTCLKEQPISLYGQFDGTFGYLFYPNGGGSPFYMDAFDATPSGDQVSEWVLYDSCQTKTTAGTRRPVAAHPLSAATGPLAPSGPALSAAPLP